MDAIAIPILYDGQWRTVGGKYSYESGKGKCIFMSKTSSFNEMHDTICRVIDVNPSEVQIKMWFKFFCGDDLEPFELRHDTDAHVFFSQQSDVSARSPLYVTGEQKFCSPLELAVEDQELTRHHFQFTQVQTMDSPPEIAVEPCALGNEDVIGVDDLADGKTEYNEFDCTHVSTCPPVTGTSPTNIVDVNTDKEIVSKAEEVSETHAMTSSSASLASLNRVKDVKVGDFFPTKAELHLKMKLLAVSRHFQTRANRSSPDLLVLTCRQKDCKWRLRATKIKGCEAFRVRKYHPHHTCSLDSLHFDHPQATTKLIAHCIKYKYEGTSQCYRPNDIRQDLKKLYGMTCGYTKAWRARELGMALARGSPEHSFRLLPLYCTMLERKNPGTKTYIETDLDDRFKYFFMALGASITGFRSCIRPVVAVDGTFLKSKYQGTLFVATCMDGNNQVYPLAFGIGDSENDNSWTWFMTKLRGCIGEVDDLVFISD